VSQVINGVLLPFVLIFMILIINKRRVMKEWTNAGWYNGVAWASVVLMVLMTIALVVFSIQGLMS
jgi:Mn2+/Fe2+ NRAMP family transporter